jgi:hypothetical protein
MIHITNGDATITGLSTSGLPGHFLAWRDPLHDGPVPRCESLAALSTLRARTLADFGWGSYAEIRRDFAQRDVSLEASLSEDEVLLWFEHDLYDQLQLLQLLDWFSRQALGTTRLTLIQIDSHPEVKPFHGLGQLNGSQLAALFPQRIDVSRERLDAAADQWGHFTSDSHENLTGLPRLQEEYPDGINGLSRTEWQLLQAASEGASSRADLYRASQAFEECPWGDASVFLRLDDLASGPNPALFRGTPYEYALTDIGRALLADAEDWVFARNGLDRWIGGVHLSGLNPTRDIHGRRIR